MHEGRGSRAQVSMSGFFSKLRIAAYLLVTTASEIENFWPGFSDGSEFRAILCCCSHPGMVKVFVPRLVSTRSTSSRSWGPRFGRDFVA